MIDGYIRWCETNRWVHRYPGKQVWKYTRRLPKLTSCGCVEKQVIFILSFPATSKNTQLSSILLSEKRLILGSVFFAACAALLYIRSKGHCECDRKLSAEKTNLIAVRLNLLNIVWLYSLLHVAILRTPSQTGVASRIGGSRDLSPQGQQHVLLWTHQTTLASHQHHRHYTAEGLTSCVEFPAMTVTPKTSSGRQSCSCRSSPWQISSSRLDPQRTGRPCQAGSAWQDFHHLRTHWGDHLDSSTPAEAFYRCQQRFAVSVGEYVSKFRLLWATSTPASSQRSCCVTPSQVACISSLSNDTPRGTSERMQIRPSLMWRGKLYAGWGKTAALKPPLSR